MKNHLPCGDFAPGNRASALPGKLRRVQFPMQRVAPVTYAKAHALRSTYGGLGRVLDAALAALPSPKIHLTSAQVRISPSLAGRPPAP